MRHQYQRQVEQPDPAPIDSSNSKPVRAVSSSDTEGGMAQAAAFDGAFHARTMRRKCFGIIREMG